LAFAVAAHLNPEILIIDEVLAVGDAAFQKKCLGKMKDVSESQGKTVLFVSHNMNAITSLCDKSVVLQKGEVVFSGSVNSALLKYANNAKAQHSVDLTMADGSYASSGNIFREISMFDSEGKPSFSFQPDSQVCFELKVSSDKYIANPKIGIGFNNDKGERVFALGTYLGPEAMTPIQGPNLVDVQFIMPPLFPGQYTIDLGFYDITEGTLSEIFGAATIEVIESNYLNMIETNSQSLGQLMVRSKWALK
jgi:lipopolysaccharide transport system ATP-binding protein